MPEMPAMPEMPDLGRFSLPDLDLPDLDLPGFENRARRDDPTPPPATSTTLGDPSAAPDPIETERMAILRALEQGELDVPTAMDRLEALDATTDAPGAPREAGDD
jgi:hypothetical protein